jgi:hypothetical protein
MLRLHVDNKLRPWLTYTRVVVRVDYAQEQLDLKICKSDST